jgi:Xaa-Pro aminopeptidase
VTGADRGDARSADRRSASRSAGERVGRLAAGLREREVDVLLVASPVNVRYLTGFTGTSGLALIAAEQAAGHRTGRHRFLTDFRYATQSATQVSDAFDREIVAGDLLEAAVGALSSSEKAVGASDKRSSGRASRSNAGGRGSSPRPSSGGRLGFDESSLTVKQHTRLRELLAAEWELVPCGGAVERLRAIKDVEEIDRIRVAAELADEALRAVLEAGVVGRTERDVAIDLELRMRRLGAESPSFPSIVAAGSHGALPHAEPRAREIRKNVLLTIDWGALHEGYCSDCTRTYATGERLSAQAREVYELVLAAQEQALAAVRAGPSGRELDGVARELIERAGHGEHFGHGLGHGVGLEVHEGPRLSRLASEEPLQVGNVVTVEPGVYLPGRLGVRIEDLVVITKDGQEVLSRLDKELTVVS